MTTDDKKESQSQALVKYEPQPLTVVERAELYAERKRQELRGSLERREIHDPFTMAVFGMHVGKFLLFTAASIALSVGSSLAISALTPKQKFTEERGRRTGDLIINSELGMLIPEVYAADLSVAQPLRSIWSLCTRVPPAPRE
jgi:hypothetical protein